VTFGMDRAFSPLAEALAARHRIERELGRGGMAVVFLATDLARGREVALTALLPDIGTSIGRERFLREIRIAGAVLDALSHAHAAEVVHRDIKADNILLHDGHPYLLDFGIARAAADAAGPLTATGVSSGTPLYMSPEQSVGDPVDARSDLDGVGSLLYEMLVGEPPHTGPS
jgi:serine/threonine-protein kinase